MPSTRQKIPGPGERQPSILLLLTEILGILFISHAYDRFNKEVRCGLSGIDCLHRSKKHNTRLVLDMTNETPRGERNTMNEEKISGLSVDDSDPLIRFLHKLIRFGVKVLAVLMVLIIFWGIGDVVWVLFQRLMQPPLMLLKINDILFLFGALLVVLIAIEIFLNITLYLREDVIHVRLVLATALMAIARKVIVFDFREISPIYVFATGAVVFALGITYWLLTKRPVR
jgi:uncharacterized membrane protein (DUF373 family)